MTRKHSTRPAAETWVEDRLKLIHGLDSYTKDVERHLTVYAFNKHPRKTIARVSLWSESVWLARID